MYDHLIGCKSKQEKQEHVCDICEKIYPNRKALSSHKIHMHVKQKVYECSVCEKSFKKPLSLKVR
jgi:ribosomal protein L37AE/L43A